MTDERTRERDPRLDPESSGKRPTTHVDDRPNEGRPKTEPKKRDPSPWTREGADAPDAADIEDPTEQR